MASQTLLAVVARAPTRSTTAPAGGTAGGRRPARAISHVPTNSTPNDQRRHEHLARSQRDGPLIGPRTPSPLGRRPLTFSAAQRLAHLGDLLEERGRPRGCPRRGRDPRSTSMTSVIRPGPRRHHDHPVRQVHGLGDRVGDEHDRGAGLARRCAAARPACARGSSRRARRTARPSAAAAGGRRAPGRSRRAAACRRTAATACGRANSASLHQLEHLVRPRPTLGLVPALQLERQLDVLARRCATRTGRTAGTPCRSPGRGAPGWAGLPFTSTVAGGRLDQVRRSAAAASTCRIPTARSATTNSPGAIGEVDVDERVDLVRPSRR